MEFCEGSAGSHDLFSGLYSKAVSIKDYLFSILGVVRGEQLKELIKEARKKRSIYEEPDINEFVELIEEIKKEIEAVFTQKNKKWLKFNYLKKQKERHALCWRKVLN